MGGESQSSPLAQLALSPFAFLGGHVYDANESGGIDRIDVVGSAIIRVVCVLQIHDPRFSDQIKLVIHRIAACCMREFIGEALDGKPVIDIRYRSQPADADMGLRGPIFHA